MDSLNTPNDSATARFSNRQDRARLPAWAMSMVLHCGAFLVFALVLRQVPSGTAVEPERTTGIAIVNEVAGKEQYIFESDENSDSQGGAPAVSSQDLAALLPSKSEMSLDLSGVLPTAPDGLADDETGGLSELGTALEGSRRASAPSGDVSTSVFGVEGTGTRFVYVFDRSGSMDGFRGAPLRAAKAELLGSLKDLQRTNQFQIIFYNERPRVFSPTGGEPKLVWGDEAGKELAIRFVESVSAAGGTQHMEALSLALRMRPDVVFFLTDADEPQMTVDELLRVRRLNNGSSIHAIEFGYGPKRSESNFLKRLARQNRGQHVYVDVAKLRSRRN